MGSVQITKTNAIEYELKLKDFSPSAGLNMRRGRAAYLKAMDFVMRQKDQHAEKLRRALKGSVDTGNKIHKKSDLAGKAVRETKGIQRQLSQIASRERPKSEAINKSRIGR